MDGIRASTVAFSIHKCNRIRNNMHYHDTVGCNGAADCISTLVMMLLIVLVCTIQLPVNPSPVVAYGFLFTIMDW